MNMQENLLTINPYSRPGMKLQNVKKIVVHYVGNPSSQAIGNRNYFENLKTGKIIGYDTNGKPIYIYASSQYIIGLQGEIIRCIPEDEVSWHAGNYAMNLNSIGIECCHPGADGKFNNDTYDSLIELLVELCQRYNLNPYTDIIRHYDVTGKVCPRYYVNNSSEWEKVKEDVSAKLNENIEEVPEDMEELKKQIANLTERVSTLENNRVAAPNINTQKYTVTANGVNVRQAPDLNSRVNKLYFAGKNVFEILEDNGAWIRSVDGWIKKAFIRAV